MTASRTRQADIGIMFRCFQQPELLIDFVRAAEDAGYDEVWIVEDCFFAGGIASVAAALAATRTIRVGLGILPAVVRNAAFAAMEIAALDRLYPGRLHPGFGHGVSAWMKQIGAFPASQLAALEEVTRAVRALLAGERVSMDGQYVHLDQVQLAFPPAIVPPVSLGVRGIKSLQLAGRCADGTILAEGASPAYVAWAVEQIRAGQQDAGRADAPHRITVYAWCGVADDPQQAYAALRPLLADAALAGHIFPYLDALGIRDEVAALVAQGRDALLAGLRDEWLTQLALVGTAEDCRAGIDRLIAAGADSVVLVPLADDRAALTTLAQTLLPG